MGGRGASFKKEGGKPSYFAETEKAVKLQLQLDYVDLETSKTYDVWIPKSQLDATGRPGEWITKEKVKEFKHPNWGSVAFNPVWRDAKGNSFGAGKTAKEKAYAKENAKKFEAGKKSYNDLIAKAKAHGVKVRVGMKRSTIEAKLKAAGV